MKFQFPFINVPKGVFLKQYIQLVKRIKLLILQDIERI